MDVVPHALGVLLMTGDGDTDVLQLGRIGRREQLFEPLPFSAPIFFDVRLHGTHALVENPMKAHANSLQRITREEYSMFAMGACNDRYSLRKPQARCRRPARPIIRRIRLVASQTSTATAVKLSDDLSKLTKCRTVYRARNVA